MSRHSISSIQVQLEDPLPSDDEIGNDNDSISSFSSSAADLINIQPDSDPSENHFQLGRDPFPPTSLVVRLNPDILPEAVVYLVEKMRMPRSVAGAELLVRCEPIPRDPRQGIVLHLTALPPRFLEVAESLGLKKENDTGLLRDFLVSELDNFLHSDITIESLITPAEKTLIVLNELNQMRSLPGQPFVPGYRDLNLHAGQSVFDKYVQAGLILTYYPLHDEEDLNRLRRSNWVSEFFGVNPTAQPFPSIRRYFGDAITLNLTFFGFYSYLLFWLSVANGVIELGGYGISTYYSKEAGLKVEECVISLVNVISITLFLKYWRRKEAELAFCWGTLRMPIWEQPRMGYRGRLGIDPVTGQYQPRFPAYKTDIRVWLVSFPVVLTLMGLNCCLVHNYFKQHDRLAPIREQYEGTLWGYVVTYGPSTTYSIIVNVFTRMNRYLANFLTEWENHRTQTTFERYRVAKLVAFESVNSLGALFYIGFIRKDLVLLKKHLMLQFIVSIFSLGCTELFVPYAQWRGRQMEDFLTRHNHPSHHHLPQEPQDLPAEPRFDPAVFGLQALPAEDPRIRMNAIESRMSPYSGYYDDYAMLFVQFGYVFLFSPVFPQSVVIAVTCNGILIFYHITKLIFVFQRPVPRRVKDIGSWESAFSFLGYLAIVSNIMLIILATGLEDYLLKRGWSRDAILWSVVGLEHFLIFLRLAIQKIIPNAPLWVRVSTARAEWTAREVWRNEQRRITRHRLTMRFQAINPAIAEHEDEDAR